MSQVFTTAAIAVTVSAMAFFAVGKGVLRCVSYSVKAVAQDSLIIRENSTLATRDFVNFQAADTHYLKCRFGGAGKEGVGGRALLRW